MSRPFKVWSADRKTKKALVASSLKELIEKGKLKLNYKKSEKILVVLESDGTIVEEEEYFQHIDSDITFVLLRQNEEWIPAWKTSAMLCDTVDGVDQVDSGSSKTLAELVAFLKTDMTKIALLSIEDLELLLATNSETLQTMLNYSLSDVERLLNACQHYIDEHAEAKEVKQLMKLLSQQQQTQQEDVSRGRKRKKLDV